MKFEAKVICTKCQKEFISTFKTNRTYFLGDYDNDENWIDVVVSCPVDGTKNVIKVPRNFAPRRGEVKYLGVPKANNIV